MHDSFSPRSSARLGSVSKKGYQAIRALAHAKLVPGRLSSLCRGLLYARRSSRTRRAAPPSLFFFFFRRPTDPDSRSSPRTLVRAAVEESRIHVREGAHPALSLVRRYTSEGVERLQERLQGLLHTLRIHRQRNWIARNPTELSTLPLLLLLFLSFF